MDVSLEDLVPTDHGLRPVRAMVDEALGRMDDTFKEICGDVGRPVIAQKGLRRACGCWCCCTRFAEGGCWLELLRNKLVLAFVR